MITDACKSSYEITDTEYQKWQAYHKRASDKYSFKIIRLLDALFLSSWLVLPILIYMGALEFAFEVVAEQCIGSMIWLFYRYPDIKGLLWSWRNIQVPRKDEAVAIEIIKQAGNPQFVVGCNVLSLPRILRAVETDDGYLLYTSEIHHLWLPRKIFTTPEFKEVEKEIFNINKMYICRLPV